MLVVDGLTKSFAGHVALQGASFEARPGRIVGFLGPNGAGKTTTMRCILGLLQPDAGQVTWNGEPVSSQTRLAFGYMPEERGLYPKMKVADQLAYFGRLSGMSSADATAAAASWLDRLGLADRSRATVEQLSHGNKQRVQLAASLVHSPTLAVLDEPFSGLDPLGTDALSAELRTLAAQGTTIVFSSHQLDLVEDLCEDVVIIAAGKVVLDGAIRELRARSSHRYLDIEMAGNRNDLARAFSEFEVVSSGDGRLRLRLDDTTPLEPLIHRAGELGRVRQFAYTPPNLSEVFREVVEQ